jgi:hypothetical protein
MSPKSRAAWKLGVVAGLATLLAWGAAWADPPLEMTCHELIGGEPSPDARHYELKDDVLTSEGVFLSSGALRLLTPYNRYSRQSAYVIHKRDGRKLYRTVFWRNKANRTIRKFEEVYDFAAQRIIEDGQDTCHHDGH